MWTPFIYSGLLVLAFGGYLYLCNQEERLGRRLILGKQRQWVDGMLEAFVAIIERKVRYVIRYIITLSWYYSLHAFLKLLLHSLASVYYLIENVLLRNRDRVRKIRKERRAVENTHLSQIAQHKVDTKLSPREEKRRKDKALKGR
jgi:hypothetical protein